MKLLSPPSKVASLLLLALATTQSEAALVTSTSAGPWQGADVGTFAALYYGSDTPANRALVISNQLLDDGHFNTSGATPATLMPTAWATSAYTVGNSFGYGPGDYSYGGGGGTMAQAANTVDNLWFQTSGTIGDTVFDLGAPSYGAVIFPVIDHGPLPQEAIESTVYLSNDLVNWTQAVVERVWLNGFNPDYNVEWDGFSYAVGTGTNTTFRYASIVHGGPGALINDGDDEINGVMGIDRQFNPTNTPEGGSTLALAGIGIAVLGWFRGRLRK